MKPLAAVREYHYWSERMISKIWHDNIERSSVKVNWSASVANLGIQVERSDPLQTRAARAGRTEEMLVDHVVRDLDYAGPVRFLAGRSSMTLSSLRRPEGNDSGAVMLFADLNSPEGKRIAICLFGSAQNICDRDVELPLWRCFGWTSSTDAGVNLLLRAGPNAEKSPDPEGYWRATAAKERPDITDLCFDAVNICTGQGMHSNYRNPAWHRGFTLGHYNDVEWLAQVYFSDYDAKIQRPYDAVHVGAAFWVRSGSPRAWVPYTPRNIERLDAKSHPLSRRLFARIWYHYHGDHVEFLRKPGRSYFPYLHPDSKLNAPPGDYDPFD